MKKTIKLFALLFVFYSFLSSCKDTVDYERIEIDLDKAFNKKTEFRIKSLVKLETTDSSLIGEITDLFMCPGYIFVFDRSISQNLFVFNQEGKYISKLKKGKGPGECLYPFAFFVDTAQKKVFVWDPDLDRMHKYDYSLNYLNSEVYDQLFINNFSKIDATGSILVNSINPPRSKVKSGISSDQLPYYNYVIYNKDFTKEISYMIPISKNLQSILSSHPISFYKGKPLFTSPLSNYIYTYDFDLKKEKIVYELDFGRYNIKPEDYQENFLKAYDLANQGERAVLISSFFYETSEFIAFLLSFKEPPGKFCIYSKKTKQHYFSPQLVSNNILPKCDFMGAYNESFIGMVEIIEMQKFNEKVNIFKDIQQVDEYDNPYIMLFDVIQ